MRAPGWRSSSPADTAAGPACARTPNQPIALGSVRWAFPLSLRAPSGRRGRVDRRGLGRDYPKGAGRSLERALRVATHEPDVRPALRRVRFLDDVEPEALVERDVALRTGLENHGGTALARVLKPELDERGPDPTSLPAGCDRNGVEMPERLGRNLRRDPSPEVFMATPTIVEHVEPPRIVDLQRIVQCVPLFGRHQHECTVSIRRLPDDPPAHHRLKEQRVVANAPFLEVVRPPAEGPRPHRLGDERAANDLRDMRKPARIARTNLHDGSSIRRRRN